ncbi:MAG: hypothetical protein GC162_14310 [Planctomycetes bacterium]|nr:hypothetical protein [Planctomycetota bacterium]
MRKTLYILMAAAVLMGAAPLTDSQKTRLDTAADGSATVDEAALYALLENAATSDGSEAGATIPDYAQMMDSPAEWRGKLCLIEGVLLAEEPRAELSREGWDKVRSLIVQVRGFDKKPGDLTAEDMAIVYLTDPPDLHAPVLQLNRNMLAETGSKVRVAARFYKVLNEKNIKGEGRLYLTFVGKKLAVMNAAERSYSPYLIAVVIGAMAMFLGWMLVRLFRRGRDALLTPPQRWEEYRQKKEEARKAAASASADEADAEPEIELPENPADALDVLAQHHPKPFEDVE